MKFLEKTRKNENREITVTFHIKKDRKKESNVIKTVNTMQYLTITLFLVPQSKGRDKHKQ